MKWPWIGKPKGVELLELLSTWKEDHGRQAQLKHHSISSAKSQTHLICVETQQLLPQRFSHTTFAVAKFEEGT
jgi:hypothetical protein